MNNDQKLDDIYDIAEKLAEKNAEMGDRVVTLEQKLAEVDRNPVSHKGNGPTAKKLRLVDGGEAWMLPHGVKAASVMPGHKSIGIDRVFHAMFAPNACKDQEALDLVKNVTTSTTGLPIPTETRAQWIDLLRAQSVLERAGMMTVPMSTKSLTWGAVTGDPTASWHAEATSDISSSDPTLAARTLTAKTITCRTTVSVEASQDSPEFGAQIAMVLSKAIAAEIDRAGLEGASNGPTGLRATSGINEVASVSTPTNYDEILDGLKALLDANCVLEDVNQFAIMSPRTWLTYEKLKTGISSDNTPLMRPKAIENMQFLTTTNVSNTAGSLSPATDSTIYLGDFRDLVMGLRQDFAFDVLRLDNYATSLLLEVVAYVRCDFVVQRPASFCKLTSVTSA